LQKIRPAALASSVAAKSAKEPAVAWSTRSKDPDLAVIASRTAAGRCSHRCRATVLSVHTSVPGPAYGPRRRRVRIRDQRVGLSVHPAWHWAHLLQLPRPGPAVTVEVIDGILDFVESAFLLTGHVTAAFAAARHPAPPRPAVIDDLQELGQWADWRDGLGLKRTLLDHGISPKPTGFEAGMAALAALVGPIEQAGRERPLLDAIAALAPEPAAVADPSRDWRYDDLAHLLAMADADHVPAAAFGHAVAVDTGNLRRGCFAGLAIATGIDHTDLAAQACRALAERTHEPRPGDLWDLLTCPMPQPFSRPDHARLTEQERDGLVAALQAESEWIADDAAKSRYRTCSKPSGRPINPRPCCGKTRRVHSPRTPSPPSVSLCRVRRRGRPRWWR
jgi:hypothetical protein